MNLVNFLGLNDTTNYHLGCNDTTNYHLGCNDRYIIDRDITIIQNELNNLYDKDRKINEYVYNHGSCPASNADRISNNSQIDELRNRLYELSKQRW